MTMASNHTPSLSSYPLYPWEVLDQELELQLQLGFLKEISQKGIACSWHF